MHRRRSRPVLVASLVSALVLVAIGLGVAGERGWGGLLATGGPGPQARVLLLDEGRAGAVAVSSTEVVTVSWRAPGERSWSSPQVVADGGAGFLIDTDVRVAGSTLALQAFYNARAPWEDEEDDEPGVASTVFTTCRDRVCVDSPPYHDVRQPPCRSGSCLTSRPESKGMTQVPELSAEGGDVFFGATEDGYVVWTPDGGLRALEPSGLPHDGVLGAPLLASDGSMRVVVGRREADRCRLTMMTSEALGDEVGRLPFTERASTSVPTTTGDCASTLEAFSGDHLLVHTDRAAPAYFVRGARGWTDTERDPTGRVRYVAQPGRTAAGDVVRTGFWHWREVLLGSPDGRRLVAQVHFPGAATWTALVTVAVAPPGSRCFGFAPTSTPQDDPFYVSMRCSAGPAAGGDAPYADVFAVSVDGRTWDSVVGDDLPTRVGEDLFVGGSPAHLWTAEDGLARVGPDVPPRSRTVLVDDGTLVLVTAVPGAGGCRLVVRVADQQDRRWSAPLADPDPRVPSGEPCRPVGQYDGRAVSLYFRSADPGPPDRVEKRAGEWVVTSR